MDIGANPPKYIALNDEIVRLKQQDWQPQSDAS